MCDDTHATRRIQKQQRVGRPQHTSVGKVLSVPRASRTRDGNTHKHHTHSATRAPKPPSRDPHTPPHVVSRVLSCDSQLRLSGRASLPKRYRKCARAIKPLSLWVITAINVQSNRSVCGSSPLRMPRVAVARSHEPRHPAPNAGCTLQPQCSASRHQCQPTVASSWDPRGIHGGILVRSS